MIQHQTCRAHWQEQGQRHHRSRSERQQTTFARRRTTTRGIVAGYMMAIEHELRNILCYHNPVTTDFWQMLYYRMGWEHLDQPPTVSGKRIRPLLTVLCTAAAGGDWHLALPCTASVEILHHFSLIHDDIQDASPLRRGHATVWAKWGEAQAIHTGDAIFTYAHLAVHRASSLPQATRLKALALLDQACIALSMGQHLDITFEMRPTVTVTEYTGMIEGKTACLLATAAELGALAAGVSAKVRAHYHAFAHHLGLLFQIRDDILGIWGAQDATGKPVDADLAQRKETLPVLYGLAHSTTFHKAFQAAQDSAVDIPTLTQLLETSGARHYAETEEQRQADLALQHLTPPSHRVTRWVVFYNS